MDRTTPDVRVVDTATLRVFNAPGRRQGMLAVAGPLLAAVAEGAWHPLIASQRVRHCGPRLPRRSTGDWYLCQLQLGAGEPDPVRVPVLVPVGVFADLPSIAELMGGLHDFGGQVAEEAAAALAEAIAAQPAEPFVGPAPVDPADLDDDDPWCADVDGNA